jgi:hypothetical protein
VCAMVASWIGGERRVQSVCAGKSARQIGRKEQDLGGQSTRWKGYQANFLNA